MAAANFWNYILYINIYSPLEKRFAYFLQIKLYVLFWFKATKYVKKNVLFKPNEIMYSYCKETVYKVNLYQKLMHLLRCREQFFLSRKL